MIQYMAVAMTRMSSMVTWLLLQKRYSCTLKVNLQALVISSITKIHWQQCYLIQLSICNVFQPALLVYFLKNDGF